MRSRPIASQRAEALVHAPTLLLGLARAQASLGQLVEANETYRRILREPLAKGAPAPFAKAVDDAAREDADVATRLAWVTLAVSGPTSSQVLLDGAVVPPAAQGVRLACNPGAHTVKVSAEGFAGAQQSFAIGEGGERTLSLTLQALAPAPVAAPIAASSGAPIAAPLAAPTETSPGEPAVIPDRTSTFHATAGWTVLGLGVVGLGVGGATGVLALDRHASLHDSCPAGSCPPQYAGEVDRYRTLANIATVATVVGGTAAAAGVILLVTSPRQRSVNVYAGALSAGVTGRF